MKKLPTAAVPERAPRHHLTAGVTCPGRLSTGPSIVIGHSRLIDSVPHLHMKRMQFTDNH
jgi:hypothetical protein